MAITARSLTLPCSLNAAAHARQQVAGALTELLTSPTGPSTGPPSRHTPYAEPPDRLSELIGDAQLIATELIANAVHAGCQRLRLSLSYHSNADPGTGPRTGHGQVPGLGELVIDVYDDAPGHPTQRQVGPQDTHGRGLSLIAALTRDWGVEHPSPEPGKHVWAALPIPPPGAGA